MALGKTEVVDRIEILENGAVQVRVKTAITEGDTQISSTFHRHVIAPGQDYSAENDRVKAVCAAVHTPAVVAAYEAALAE